MVGRGGEGERKRVRDGEEKSGRQAAREMAVTRKQEKSQWEGWNLMSIVGAQAYMIPRTGKMEEGVSEFNQVLFDNETATRI